MYFLLMAFVLPALIERGVDAAWVIICAVISLVITVVPEYLTTRLKRKRVDTHALAMKKKLVRIAVAALGLFLLMAFAFPAVMGESVDTAWVIISAVASLVTAVIADYLTTKRENRRKKNAQE